MIASELEEVLAEIKRPERFGPVLVRIGDQWQTVADVRLDEDRVILELEPFGG